MAKYLISSPAVVDGQFIQASPSGPVVAVFPDSLEPSRTWEPLDKAAVAALKKLGVKKTLAAEPEEAETVETTDTLASIQGQLPEGAERM